jgi:hypothetical protein
MVTIPDMDNDDDYDYVSHPPTTSTQGGVQVNLDGDKTTHPPKSIRTEQSAPITPTISERFISAPPHKRPSLIPTRSGSTWPSPVEDLSPALDWDAPGPSSRPLENTPTPAPPPHRRSDRLRKPPVQAPSIYEDAKPTDILKQKSKDWRIASGDLKQNSKPRMKKQPVAKEVPVLPAPAPTPVRSPIAERLQGTVKTRLATKAPVPEPQLESISILDTISESYQERNQRILHDSATPTKQADTDEGKLAREGGVNHVHMLFKAAVSNSKPISNYSYRDVAVLPPQERSKWLGPNGALSIGKRSAM